MSPLRAPREPGRHMLTMDNSCGFDGGDNDHPGCGQPATLHLFAGKPPATIGDHAMLACDRHAENAKKLAIDWHPVDPVCGVPDSMWQFKAEQGRGFCFWPYAEKAIHDAASQDLSQKSHKHAGT